MHSKTQKDDPLHAKRVLGALDDSPRATAVFDAGAEYARSLEAELNLFRTITIPPHFPPPSGSSDDDPLPRRLSEIAEHNVNSIAERASDVAAAETLITFGLPGQMILETARKLSVDLIVLGSHGYRDWDRVLNTTAAVICQPFQVQCASCSSGFVE